MGILKTIKDTLKDMLATIEHTLHKAARCKDPVKGLILISEAIGAINAVAVFAKVMADGIPHRRAQRVGEIAGEKAAALLRKASAFRSDLLDHLLEDSEPVEPSPQPSPVPSPEASEELDPDRPTQE